jgi:hypothetical protein
LKDGSFLPNDRLHKTYYTPPDLRNSFAALKRAAKRARVVAANTGTHLVVAHNGKYVLVAPGKGKSAKV